jgi:hypothetical protein
VGLKIRIFREQANGNKNFIDRKDDLRRLKTYDARVLPGLAWML